MHTLGRGGLAPLLVLLVAGCASGGAEPSDEGVAAGLRAQQEALSAEALQSLEGRVCVDLPERARLETLPDLTLSCLGRGPARAVDAGDGRPTVVNLWASWCAPCVREMPLLQLTADRAGDDARFVGIDVQDEPASAAGLLQATGVRYDQYADPDGEVRSALRAVGLPVTLVFDADGREVGRRFGEIEDSWLDDALRDAGVSLPATDR